MSGALRVLITGAAGQVAYSLSHMVANGNLFGNEQMVILHLFDIPESVNTLKGVVMELQDCAFPTLENTVFTSDLEEAFKNIDVAFMVGSTPYVQGMVRKDLLKGNASIFRDQGRALDKYAKKTVKVLIVANPVNTNCLIMSKYAPSIPKENFSALSRLDHNRIVYQVADKLGVQNRCVKNVTVWGNHSDTQVPDISHAVVCIDKKSVSVKEAINDEPWVKDVFTPLIQSRGFDVLAIRNWSSAAAAAKATVDQMRDLWFSTMPNDWVSMGVYSNGEYGVAKDTIFSFPVTTKDGTWKIVEGLEINDWVKGLIDKTSKDLIEEKKSISIYLD